jgi:hypothetical protein
MRSSKSRSRSKTNRPRTIGNIINRVFDSSGPEGKVRGTPQQIIDKYLTLSRDAQLSNDRVAAENFQQHAEHYTRMLGEAMREMAAEQDQRRDSGGPNGNQNGSPNANSNGNAYSGQNGGQNGNGYGQGGGAYANSRDRQPRDDAPDAPSMPRGGSVIELADEGDDNGLVETPEARSRAESARSDYVARTEYADRAPQGERPDRAERQDRRNDRPRYPQNDRKDDRRPPAEPPAPAATPPAPAHAPVAVEPLAPMMPSFAPLPDDGPAEAKPASVRRPRAPRKPKDAGGSSDGGPAEAAE